MSTHNDRKRLFDELEAVEAGEIDLNVVYRKDITHNTAISTPKRKKANNEEASSDEFSDVDVEGSDESETLSQVEASSESECEEVRETLRSISMQLEQQSCEKNANSDKIESDGETRDNPKQSESFSDDSRDSDVEEIIVKKEIVEISSDTDSEKSSVSSPTKSTREEESDDDVEEVIVRTETVLVSSDTSSDENSESPRAKQKRGDDLNTSLRNSDLDPDEEVQLDDLIDTSSDENSESPRAKQKRGDDLNTSLRNSDLAPDDEEEEVQSDDLSDIIINGLDFDGANFHITFSKRLDSKAIDLINEVRGGHT
ncbi:clumping factor A-like [Palaemon carinicauda]|uniref:clumping factor A-like n=1 Tax=Palaemon carinicauda TaxID=392227 RepID=UPI0035B61C1F